MITRRQTLILGAAAVTVAIAPAARAQARFYPEDFGAYGDATADDARAINACDLAASAAGATVVFRNRYRVGAQLLMSANWHFEGAEIVRDWTGRHRTDEKDASATIKGRGNDELARFYVNPGPFQPTRALHDLSLSGSGTIRMSEAARAYYDGKRDAHATTLYMLCDNFRIGPGLRFALGGNDWCITYGGNNFRGDGFAIYSQTGSAVIYEDGFHVIYGRNGRLSRPTIESGDDCIAFANTWNLPISDWIVDTPVLFSHCAFGIKIASQRLGATASFAPITQPLENIHVTGPVWAPPNGRRSRNGYVRFDASGTRPGIIRNCTVTAGKFEGRNNGLPSGMPTGVAAISFAGPVENSLVQARIRHASLWAAQMSAGSDGRGPIKSGIEIESPDLPNWAKGGRSIQAIDLRGASRDSWISGPIAKAP